MNSAQQHNRPRSSNLKVVLSGGGTGGHLYPALAIAESLRSTQPGIEIMFVGANGKIEMEKVPEHNFPIEGLPVKGISRTNPFKNLDLPFRLTYCMWKSRSILMRFKPDIVVGTGGYASGPLAYMAARRGIPVLLQEQNFYPGLTNRVLARYARKICVAFEGMQKWLPNEKLVLTGNPVRKDLLTPYKDRNSALSALGMSPDKKTVLVLGGSGGAPAINKAVAESLEEWAKYDIQVLWQTGKNYYEALKGQQYGKNVYIYPFISNMRAAYYGADIVIARAGALTLAELAVCGRAAILVPSPNVVADHQMKNAEALLEQNAAMIIPDDEVDSRMEEEVLTLINDDESRELLEKNMAKTARPEATNDIVKQILELTGTNA